MLGGIAGFAVGGPFGAVLGATLGRAAEEGLPRISLGDGATIQARLAAAVGGREHLFSMSVVMLTAKLAKCDGPVVRLEIDAFKRQFRIPPEQIPGLLVKNFAVLLPWLPTDPHDLDFAVDRYRETRTVATVAWDEPFDRVIPRWMKTMTVPTMVMWGNDDALIPVGQAKAWGALVPDSDLRLFDDAGHLLLDESPAAVGAVAEFCK